jgi:hypothetical protein
MRALTAVTKKAPFGNDIDLSDFIEPGVGSVNVTEEDGEYEFTVTETQNGGQSSFINWEFLASQELRNMIGIHEKFGNMLKGVYAIDERSKRKSQTLISL